MNNHCHHNCEHKEVKFCKDCKTVYCASCKEQWFEKCTLNHYTNSWCYITSGYRQIMGGTSTPEVSYTVPFSSTSCSHDMS